MNHLTPPEHRAPPMSPEPDHWDRRRTARLPVAEGRVLLGWRTDDDFVVTRATLLNISQGGALLAVDLAPGRAETVWLRLEGPTAIEDVCAVVLETLRFGRGEHGVRLAFREPFPPEFYLAAIEGLGVSLAVL